MSILQKSEMLRTQTLDKDIPPGERWRIMILSPILLLYVNLYPKTFAK